MSFCLSDGALLSAPYDHPSTQGMGGYSTSPPAHTADTVIFPSTGRAHLPTETMDPLEASTMRRSQAPTVRMERPAFTSKRKFILIGLVALVVLAAGVFAVVKWRGAKTPAADPAALAKFSDQLRNKQGAWVEHVFIAQGSKGGIKESAAAADNTQQVWATAQCLVGMLSTDRDLTPYVSKIKAAFAYIKSLRRTTPSDGWNLYSDESPYTLTEIGAWVTLAHIMSLDSKTKIWNDPEREDMIDQVNRDLAEIRLRQSESGGFRPIRDDQPTFTRTYPTLLALWVLTDARRSTTMGGRVGAQHDEAIRKCLQWLLGTYKAGQGWVPNPNRLGQTGKYAGLNAQTLWVMSRVETLPEFAFLKTDQIYKTAKLDFIQNKQFGTWNADESNSNIPDADGRFPGTGFNSEGSTFLWFPWSLAELSQLSHDDSLAPDDRNTAAALRLEMLKTNAAKLDNYVETANLTYVMAENLVCVSAFLGKN
jgi:hypothetical protein